MIIEEDILFGENVYISDNFNGRNSVGEVDILPINRELYSKGLIYIGKNVWLGRNICVMLNVTVGDCTFIGAKIVVTHDIPAYDISAGVSAKVIKMIK